MNKSKNMKGGSDTTSAPLIKVVNIFPYSPGEGPGVQKIKHIEATDI
jgi:hypothetical protein